MEAERTQLLQQVKSLKQQAIKDRQDLQDLQLDFEKDKKLHQDAATKHAADLQELQSSLMQLLNQEQAKTSNLESKLKLVIKEKHELET